MNFDINFDWNFWSILFLTLGYILGSFMKGVGRSSEQDQIIRDLAQIQATNRDLEIQNDRLNQTLFESTKENQRLLIYIATMNPDDTDVYGGKKVTYLDPLLFQLVRYQMNNHRRVMQIPSPRYFLDLDYVTIDNCILNFENAYYNYKSNEWEYKDDTPNGLIPESRLSELITEDEERRVALDYEREEHHKNSLYKSIGIY